MHPVVVRRASELDAPAITALVNQAFSVERFFVAGDRTHEGQVRELLARGGFLLGEIGRELVACVYVEQRGDRGYFGMLSVSPPHQRGGLGHHMIDVVERTFREARCIHVDIKIMSLRLELPPFYTALGYQPSGTMPVPTEEQGALLSPAHFILMSKPL